MSKATTTNPPADNYTRPEDFRRAPDNSAKIAELPPTVVNSAKNAELRDARALKPLPILSCVWMLDCVEGDDAAEEFAAGVESVKEQGIIRPITITVQDGVEYTADGRHRRAWAIAAAEQTGDESFYQVPVELVPLQQATALIRAELFARRQMGKGQKAWAYVQLNASLLHMGGGRPSKSRQETGITDEEAAAEAGVKLRTFQMAKQLHALLAKFKDSKEKGVLITAAQKREAVEARIWQGDGLDSILADLKPAPNDAKQQQDSPEVDPNLDIKATEAVNRFSQLLLDWETEIITGESHRLLPAPALLDTTRRTCGLTTALLEGLIGCPDIMDTHKAQILSDLQATLTAARESLTAK